MTQGEKGEMCHHYAQGWAELSRDRKTVHTVLFPPPSLTEPQVGWPHQATSVNSVSLFTEVLGKGPGDGDPLPGQAWILACLCGVGGSTHLA